VTDAASLATNDIERFPDGHIARLDRIDAWIEPYDWAFARDNEAQIAAHWARISAGKPAMFNGRILLQHRAAIINDVFQARYFETDYAAFMTWRDAGHPGPALRNGFAMGALRAADGAFLCGRMSGHTANGGMVYFAAGTPDRSDVRADGTVDLAGSVLRELAEETGLTEAEVRVGEGWHAVFSPGRVAFMRPLTINLPAEEARSLMLSRMAGLAEQELDDIVILRSAADCDRHKMALFMKPYLSHIFAQD
jgi:8-oxo-dGTP pyrophosphatase MutT (NUDIX family)